jgi:nucleotide-binding universal stress UspA family protein
VPAFQRVLVPVDFAEATDDVVAAGHTVRVGNVEVEFAPASARSLELAASLVAADGEVRVVHATPALERTSVYTSAGRIGGLGTAIDDIHRHAHEASMEVLSHLAGRHCGGRKLTFGVRPGPPLRVILEEARDFGADLIVLAASGRSRVARFFVGSTADRVIRQAGCPVMVVPTPGPAG